jgi:hypothetical protein
MNGGRGQRYRSKNSMKIWERKRKGWGNGVNAKGKETEDKLE